MGKITAFFRLTRIEHSIMLMIAVLAGELVARGIPGPAVLIASMITPAFVSMGSFAINDYFDMDVDKANRYHKRPLVSGELSTGFALWASISFLVVGPFVSLLISPFAFLIAVIFALLAFLYSYVLKGTLLVGNAYIAFSMAIPFIYGAVVSSGTVPPVIWLVVLVTFLSGLAREIHGMIRDHRGDSSARNISNVVTHMGGTRSAYFSLVLYAEAIAISIYMFFLFRPFAGNLAYLIPILAVDSMLGYVGIAGVVSKRPDRFHRYVSRNLSLIAMTLALLTYLVSAILYLPV